MTVKAQDLFDAVFSHDGEMNCVSSRKVWMADDDVPSALDYFEIYR